MKILPYKLVTWDWKDIPDINEVSKAVKQGYINLYNLDTDGDFFCWLFSKTPLTKKQLNEITKKEFYGED